MAGGSFWSPIRRWGRDAEDRCDNNDKAKLQLMSSLLALLLLLEALFLAMILEFQVWILHKSQENEQNPDKHGHGNGRARKKPGECYQSSTSVNL
ncbi:hypothetical protein Tco_1410452 [Tanacetum coccineum]